MGGGDGRRVAWETGLEKLEPIPTKVRRCRCRRRCLCLCLCLCRCRYCY